MSQSTPDVDLFRRAMGRFATGVTVLTTRTGDHDHAMTASALTSVSLEPLLVLVCVEREARFHDAVVEAGIWGISVLSSHDRPAADWLATRADTEKDGPLTTHITNLILTPTAYSKMR